MGLIIKGHGFDCGTVDSTIIADYYVRQRKSRLDTLASGIEVVVSVEPLNPPRIPVLRGNGFWIQSRGHYVAYYAFESEDVVIPVPQKQTHPLVTAHRIFVSSEEQARFLEMHLQDLRSLLPQTLRSDDNCLGYFRETLNRIYPNLAEIS